MTAKVKAILDAALALGEEDRALIAERLLASLDHLASLSDDEFVAELDRRAEEARRDPGSCIPWDELKNERPCP